MNRRILALVAVAVLHACTCGKTTKTDDVTPPDKSSPVVLSPLPKVPELKVDPLALPGADGALAIVASRPQGEMQGEVRPTVTFNKPVKSLEMVESQRAGDAAKPFATIEPALPGEWRWLGSASAEFVPKGLVPMSSTFKVTILKGLTALDGATLEEDFSYSFSTPALQFQSSTPETGFKWLAPDQKLSLLTNQPVKDADLVQGLSVSVEGQPFKLVLASKVSIEEERRKEMEAAKKSGRAYERLTDEERGWANQQWRYVFTFDKPLPLGKALRVTFSPTLHGEQGPLPMDMHPLAGLEYRTYGPMKLSSAKFCEGAYKCPYGPLVIFTTNEGDVSTLKERFKVTPAVEIDWDNVTAYVPNSSWQFERQSPYFSLPGKWKPGVQYKLEIASGVGDVFKQAAGEGLSANLRTDDLTPVLITGSSMGVVEAAQGPKLPVEVSNLKTLEVKLWKATIDEMITFASAPMYDRAGPLSRAADFAETEKLKYPRNVARVHPIQLSKVLGDAKTGIVVVSTDSPDLEYDQQPTQQLVQVTDLATHLKIGPKSSLAWVTRLSDGAVVADADVTVYGKDGKQLWAGKTNAEGLAEVPGTAALDVTNPKYAWEYPFLLVVAQKDTDTCFTANTWSEGVEPYEFGLQQGWEGTAPESHGFLFTDRGIYRPGDDVFVKGVVRYRVVGELRAPKEGSSMAVVVEDSKGNKLFEKNVKVTKYGTFSLQTAIGKDAPTGPYSVTAKGQANGGEFSLYGSFRVEEYRAPQFRVDVDTKSKSLIAGDALEATISARYLFGGAMNDAATKWSAHRESTSFTTDTAPDFTFQQETWWWDDNQPQSSNGFVSSGDGRVDAQGNLVAKVGSTEAPGEKPYAYTVEAEVTDVNRQAVAGRVEVLVHPASYYVGLRSPAYFLDVGTEYGLETLTVDPAGKRVAGKAVEVLITSRSWKSVKKKDASGGFSTISEPVEEEAGKCSLQSADAAVPCKFKATKAGFYIVRASVKDEQGRKHSSSLGVYATGSDWVAWQRNDTDRVELVTDKTKYDVGDVARVLIKSPYPAAKAMFTVEREGVLERRLVDLKGSVSTVDVKITEDMVPNVFAGVLIMRPRVAKDGIESGDDPGRPNARIGLVKLNVEKKAKRLTVNVSSDKKDYQPRETVNVTVDAKDSAGKGANGEVTLYVVDEAVLRLTAYKTPDPIESIFTDRPLSVRMGEPLLHLVRRRNYGEKGESQGGGGGSSGEGGGFRSQFKTTVLFSPTVELKDGVAKATFQLPDNLTSFRVMAVVVTQQERFGSGETLFQVNKPLMALPAMPRFARVGDTFEAGVVVHAKGAASEVSVTAQVEGGAELTGPAEQKIQAGEGAPKEVRFAFKASKPGLTKFRFKVSGGGNSDGVEEKLPIELPVEIDAVATYGDTTDNRVEGIVPPKDVMPDQGGLTVTMTSTSMGNFATGMQQLIEYPYGCLEQQSSRLVPFVALREIAGQFGVPWPGADKKKLAATAEESAWLSTYLFKSLDTTELKHPDDVINTTVKSILSLQEQDGAFRYWADAWCPNSWASAYATMALSRAKDVGFDVPADRLMRAEKYLTRVVGGQCSPCELGCPLETRVFASYVLARMKKPKASAYGEFLTHRNELSLFSQALLANAMYVGGGDRAQANALLQELLNHAKESAKGVHIEEVNSRTYATYFQSDTRTTGVVLQALTDIAPTHPYVGKMTQYLTSVREGNGEWRSTQEAAFSLMALTQVLRTKEKDTPDFTAKVAMGAGSLAETVFKGRSMTAQTKVIPMKELLEKAAGADQKLTFSKQGTGVLYYSALLQYAPKELPTKSLEAGLFVQRWFEPYTGGGQSLKFFAGDLVRVRVRVSSNQERHWTAFEIPLPAGLEPLDTTLATNAKLTAAPDEESRGEGYEEEGGEDAESGDSDGYNPWVGRFYSPFTHTELRDNRIIVFADHLPPGVHVASFVTRATTPGKYVLKPAKGALMYEPEVFGRSEGGTFEVAIPTTVTQKE